MLFFCERCICTVSSPISDQVGKPGKPCHDPPLSRSHSGDDAPLHALRGPSTGEIRPKSDRVTVLGRSRLQGRDVGAGEDEEEEEDGVGDGESDEDMPKEE